MPRTQSDVVLITSDSPLRALVERCRPSAARLECLSSQEVTDADTLQARQIWVDLDSGADLRVPDGERRVYFYSQRHPHSESLPPGLFIRKPCAPAVLHVLWAGVDMKDTAVPRATAPAEGRLLPAWLLAFHELDLKVLCRKCVADLAPRLGYGDASLYLHDVQHGVLTLAETTHTRAIDLAVRLDACGQNLMSAVARSGRWLRTDCMPTELAADRIARETDPAYPDQDCLVAPLLSDGRLWGVLNFSGRARTALTEVGLPLDEIFAFLARALQHARAYEDARIEARVDSLTGLYNQRWMTEALEKEIRRAHRFGTPLSALMIDLDGLKAVNDQTGHAAGDCLLRHLAGRISAVLRQFDGAARVGGDEFVVMLPGTDAKGAQQVAHRLLRSVREDVARFEDHLLPITASIGAAEWCADWDARQLLVAADRAMYAAKGQGRNRFVSLPPNRPPTVRLGKTTPPAAQSQAPTRFTQEPPLPKPAPEPVR
jgi:diguanylate cyclase (GGDEF)-like protein